MLVYSLPTCDLPEGSMVEAFKAFKSVLLSGKLSKSGLIKIPRNFILYRVYQTLHLIFKKGKM